MIEIDGSYGEAGGQILRTSVALSAATGVPCRIHSIRSKRPNPGLRPQHLVGLRAAARMCEAEVEGDEVGSSEVTFRPGTVRPGSYRVDVGTAGAVTLVLQTLLPVTLRAGGEVQFDLTGGTCVAWSPTVGYFRDVLCWYLAQLGIKVDVEVVRHGFYPKGGGRVKAKVSPGKLGRVKFVERGELEGIYAESIASEGLRKAGVAERQAEAFLRVFPEAEVKLHYVESKSPGSCLHAWARYEGGVLGGDALGERGKRAEQVGREAAELLRAQVESEAPLDEWMADQILPFMAFSALDHGERMEVRASRVTEHARTNIWVVERFLPVRFLVEGKDILCEPWTSSSA